MPAESYRDYLHHLEGLGFVPIQVPGKIGDGDKVHMLYARAVTDDDGTFLVAPDTILARCGSVRWCRRRGRSPLRVLDGGEITCAKCLKKFK